MTIEELPLDPRTNSMEEYGRGKLLPNNYYIRVITNDNGKRTSYGRPYAVKLSHGETLLPWQKDLTLKQANDILKDTLELPYKSIRKREIQHVNFFEQANKSKFKK